MKYRHFLLATAVSLTAGTMSFAAEPSAKTEGGQDAKQEKKICKSEKLTGSLTRVQRTCMTKAEWDRLAEGTNKNIDALTRDANRQVAGEWRHGES